MSAPDRKPKRLLTAEQKYDLWVRMLAGQVTEAQAAAEACVDRSGAAGHRRRPSWRRHADPSTANKPENTPWLASLTSRTPQKTQTHLATAIMSAKRRKNSEPVARSQTEHRCARR